MKMNLGLANYYKIKVLTENLIQAANIPILIIIFQHFNFFYTNADIFSASETSSTSPTQ